MTRTSPFSPAAAALLALAVALCGAASTFALALDPVFHAPRFVRPNPAPAVLPLPDGKFLRFFNTNSLVDTPTGPLTRHLSDGALDTSFNFSRNYSHVGAGLALLDGKVIVSARRTSYGAVSTEEMLRLNTDGSIDTSWGPVLVSSNPFGGVRGLVLQPDGKMIVSGQFTAWAGDTNRPGIVRLLADGTLDPAFAPVPLFTSTSTSTPGTLPIDDPILQPDGKIVIFGNFRRIGTTNLTNGIARLNSDGTLDTSFIPSGFSRSSTPRTAVRQVDGKIVVGGRFSVTASFAANPTGATYSNLPAIRLHTDGSADQTYGYFNASAPGFYLRDSVILPDGRIVATNPNAGWVFRFNTNGTVDSSFHQPIFQVKNPSAFEPYPSPSRLYLLGDGRLLIGGTFTDVDRPTPDASNFGVVRLNSDGTVDPALTMPTRTGFLTFATEAALLASGKTLISFNGEFSASNDTPAPNDFVRLNRDGTVDNSYNPFTTAPLTSDFTAADFVRLPGDEVLLFGNKLGYGDFIYGKLLSSGSQDPAFTADPAVTALFGYHDGHILFRDIHGLLQPGAGVLLGDRDAQGVVDGSCLVRLKVNGARDGTFVFPQSILGSVVVRSGDGYIDSVYADTRLLTVQPDGKLLFVYLTPDLTARLVRLNANGSIDSSFTPVTVAPLTTTFDFPIVYDPLINVTLQPLNGGYYGPTILDAEVQSDGRIVLVGPFKSINGSASRGIARVTADGSVDATFAVGSGPAWSTVTEADPVRPIVEQVESESSGKLLISGTFESFNGVAAPGFARLNADGSVESTFTSPVVRNKFISGQSVLIRQADGSFFLSGPYTTATDSTVPALIHLFDAPAITSAVSKITHGSAGDFDLPLPLTGTPAVESRGGGNYSIVITLNNDLMSGGASVTSGTGSVTGMPFILGKKMIVGLSGVADAQRVTITLHNVTDIASQVLPDTNVTVRFLAGDTNGDGFVNSADLTQTRSRSGQTLDATNFRSDINGDGFINSADATAVRARSGNSVP